jgi:phage baseplate assembly protein W
MTYYQGFSTQEATVPLSTNIIPYADSTGQINGRLASVGAKFTISDNNLVVRDLLNALNIRKGEKVGQPDYGTTLWDYVFEQGGPQTISAVENEIRRIIGLDSRIILNTLNAFQQDQGILIQMEIAVELLNQPGTIAILASNTTGRAGLV